MNCFVAATDDFVAREYEPTEDVARSPILGWLSGLILQTQREGRLPCRSDVGPRRIGPHAMPSVLMVDVEAEPRRYRIRLIGTRLVKLTGSDRTGQHFDDLGDEFREVHGFYMRTLDRLVARRKPLLFTGNLFYRGQEWKRYRCLVSPCSSDGRRVDLLVGAVEPLAPRI